MISTLLVSMLVTAPAITTKNVDYMVGEAPCQGYLAYDRSVKGKRPGVLVVPDWDSITSHEKAVAQNLAKLGYVAFVADIYGKKNKPKNTQENAKFAGMYKSDRVMFCDRLMGALDQLTKFNLTDKTKTAAIGYCFGGTGVLELARMGADLKGVVSFHGGLDADPNLKMGPVLPRILILHGADDPLVPQSQIDEFKAECHAAGAKVSWEIYPGAVHAFTVKTAGNNPKNGFAYNKEADEKSWKAMKTFLYTIFK